jgi:hypothetical protein
MISAELDSFLRSARSDLNERFAAARHIYPDLQPEAFYEFLRTNVDELVRSLEHLPSDQITEAAMAAYDTGLQLVGQKLMGPEARLPEIIQGWHRILPRISSKLATAPRQIIPAVCNAIYQIKSTPGARPQQWIELMERLGPETTDVESFLTLGWVSAWRAGLAHFRSGAIAALETLPNAVRLSALEADPAMTWEVTQERLRLDPWFDPSVPEKRSRAGEVVAQVGSFRGFGGLFVEPPIVTDSGDHFLARSNNECWLVTADAFGATFHRSSLNEFDLARANSAMPARVSIDRKHIALDGTPLQLASLGELTSAAANDTTLAVTLALTHSIVLIALN